MPRPPNLGWWEADLSGGAGRGLAQSSLGTLSLPSGALRCVPWATQGSPGSGSNEEAGGCPLPMDEEPGD